jgi:hypothetical protein
MGRSLLSLLPPLGRNKTSGCSLPFVAEFVLFVSEPFVTGFSSLLIRKMKRIGLVAFSAIARGHSVSSRQISSVKKIIEEFF